MVKWENVCLPKDFGGPGILNKKAMNEALLTKWIWRILSNKEDYICCQLLRAKYLKRKMLHQCNAEMDHSSGKASTRSKETSNGGGSIVHNGRDTSFWEDVWVGEVPLKLVFPRLYDYCRDKSCAVGDCWKDEKWTMEFRRTLSIEEANQWEELVNKIRDIEITEEADTMVWALEKSGQYTTRSMYRMMTHRGVINYRLRKVWGCKMSMKLKIFLAHTAR